MSIRAEHLTHIYNAGTVMESAAVRDVSFEIPDGCFVGLIGHTGSGKSTLIQHLNGLVKPSEGTIYFNDEDIFREGYDLRKLRGQVGLVFQYPEYQLFEEDVITDVMFGPKNMGLDDAAARKRAEGALAAVGMEPDCYKRSPFELSGGQKRRVAIAGVLAMHPRVLVLDEPTAGLDPSGRDEILGMLKMLHEKHQLTIVLVSHSMDDVAEYADKIMVLDHGRLAFFDTPREVFSHVEELEALGLAVPEITYLAGELCRAGFPIDPHISKLSEAREAILGALGLDQQKTEES